MTNGMFTLQKLTPNQDLQCYFYQPSAVAALSATSPNGFTVSGCWRAQSDWVVVEWNRDNVFEHPVFRNLPDGDLSGLQLSYQESRTNCITIDSTLYPTVDWPYLRVWADPGSGEELYRIPLMKHATPVVGSYTPASATFELQGSATGGDYIELAWDQEHYTYQLYGIDTLESAAEALANSINRFSKTMQASAKAAAITLTLADSTTGSNGNRVGVYGNVYSVPPGTPTECWQQGWQLLGCGVSPTTWQVNLDFRSISGLDHTDATVPVPMNAVRKLRWTWAADLQAGNFARSEFEVAVSGWTAGGTGLTYQVAGPGSWRAEDTDVNVKYVGAWSPNNFGNYSGGSINYATRTATSWTPASVFYAYNAPANHYLFLGTRRFATAAQLSVQVDSGPARTYDLSLPGEDGLVRLNLFPASQVSFAFFNSLGSGYSHTITIGPTTYTYVQLATDGSEDVAMGMANVINAIADPNATASVSANSVILTAKKNSGAGVTCSASDGNGSGTLIENLNSEFPTGNHIVTVTHNGAVGSTFYFDFFEVALPTSSLPTFPADAQMTLATDWDTLHSQALAPERTAWLIQALGFTGRANHYAGALWFYELTCAGNKYATGTITMSGVCEFGMTTSVSLGPTEFKHLNLIGDTPASLAQAFALLINEGSTGVWALAEDGVLTITARATGNAGNGLMLSGDAGDSTTLHVQTSRVLAGGVDGKWLTDLTAAPRINRAARDWTRSFYAALKTYGIEVTASFSTELGNGDPSAAAGIAQRYPDGSPCLVNTPALQTNFSPASLAYWQQVYLDMANVMAAAGVQPYLQFGEVQWWYFCPPTDPAKDNWKPLASGGMPFYDSYTTDTFQSQYRSAMHVFMDPSDDPSPYPQESAFLPGLIGEFTTSIMAFVRRAYPNAQFEVRYPPDTNDAPLMRVMNLPAAWAPLNLDCFKTENFTYTGDYNLDKAVTSTEMPMQLGFAPANSAHLVGIGNYTAPWAKESRIAKGLRMGSVVLFALDQCCLIGYGLPGSPWPGLGLFMGA